MLTIYFFGGGSSAIVSVGVFYVWPKTTRLLPMWQEGYWTINKEELDKRLSWSSLPLFTWKNWDKYRRISVDCRPVCWDTVLGYPEHDLGTLLSSTTCYVRHTLAVMFIRRTACWNSELCHGVQFAYDRPQAQTRFCCSTALPFRACTWLRKQSVAIVVAKSIELMDTSLVMKFPSLRGT
jgi:hypothetical protein